SIGIAHQRNGRERHSLALLALGGASAAYSLQATLDRMDALMDAPTVGFELGFARAARADARAQSRHRRPVSCQSRQQVVQLRELYLQLSFSGTRATRENIQD